MDSFLSFRFEFAILPFVFLFDWVDLERDVRSIFEKLFRELVFIIGFRKD